MNATYRYGRGLVCGLLLGLLGACSTPLQNSAVPNAAHLWVGQDGGSGRWSVKPGDADIEITDLDSIKGDFPPLGYLDTAADLSAPLNLVPGRHSIGLLFGAAFQVYSKPGAPSETVQCRGSGSIDQQFLENHEYRITALWLNTSASRPGTFDVTLWDVTVPDASPAAVQSWSFRGSEVTGPPGYVSLFCPSKSLAQSSGNPKGEVERLAVSACAQGPGKRHQLCTKEKRLEKERLAVTLRVRGRRLQRQLCRIPFLPAVPAVAGMGTGDALRGGIVPRVILRQ